MARLNDFAAPSESVEALKRRFVRQNREIARVNSMQSLRIRSLESEVSHLLAENVSLREQVINLTQEIERLQAAKLLHDGVYEIKGRLDTKLAELTLLISDLGSLPRKVGKLNGERSEESRPKATASESRPRMTDSEYHAGVDDGKLPAIMEDKYYPRRTLEPQEIQNLMHANPDLPESPEETPLSHEEPSPVSDSPSQELNQSPSECQADDDAPAPSLSLPSTLETRRKKRIETAALECEEPASSEHQSPKVDLSKPAKSGAKRKFSPDDDGLLSDSAPEDDEFQFSRPSHSPQKLSDPFEFLRQDLSPSKTPADAKRESAKQGITKRKVLEPKSANANLGSPKKARAVLNPDKMSLKAGGDENMRSPVKPKEFDNHKSKTLGPKARNRSTPVLQKQKRSSRTTDSGDAMQSQDTPTILKDSPVAKSGEGLPGMADLMAASRPSRRQRAVVSYAEPNLRDKMRRPTSELIDAVGGHGPRRSSSFHLARESLGDESEKSRKPGTSPCPPATNNFPADFALAVQSSTEGFAKDGTPDELSVTVSRHRQSRRHSSNPKSTSRGVSPQRDMDPVSASSPGHKSPTSGPQFDDEENTDWKSTSSMDSKFRRETRVAARRKSMMV